MTALACFNSVVSAAFCASSSGSASSAEAYPERFRGVLISALGLFFSETISMSSSSSSSSKRRLLLVGLRRLTRAPSSLSLSIWDRAATFFSLWSTSALNSAILGWCSFLGALPTYAPPRRPRLLGGVFSLFTSMLTSSSLSLSSLSSRAPLSLPDDSASDSSSSSESLAFRRREDEGATDCLRTEKRLPRPRLPRLPRPRPLR